MLHFELIKSILELETTSENTPNLSLVAYECGF